MMELAGVHLKCKHREAGIQKVFPNAAFGLPNGRNLAPNGMGETAIVVQWARNRFLLRQEIAPRLYFQTKHPLSMNFAPMKRRIR